MKQTSLERQYSYLYAQIFILHSLHFTLNHFWLKNVLCKFFSSVHLLPKKAFLSLPSKTLFQSPT